MSSPSPAPGLRQRGGKRDEAVPSPSPQASQAKVSSSKSKDKSAPKQSQWDYKLAIVVLTILAFATRFWKISFPDQVVFDEVHFGKVSSIFDAQCDALGRLLRMYG